KLADEDEAQACAVVVLVGEGDARLAVEAMKSGAHDCLEKDRARGAELRRSVSRAIEKAEQWRRNAANERELIETNRAHEANVASLRRAGAGREQGEGEWQVARAAAGSHRAVVTRPENAFHDRAEEQLKLLKTAVEQIDESVIITTAQFD